MHLFAFFSVLYCFCFVLFLPAGAWAKTFSCSGFEPTFDLTLSENEIVLISQGESSSVKQHFSPVQVTRGNKTELYAYLVKKENNEDFIAIVDGSIKGECASDFDGKFTHKVYYYIYRSYGYGGGIADGCCILK